MPAELKSMPLVMLLMVEFRRQQLDHWQPCPRACSARRAIATQVVLEVALPMRLLWRAISLAMRLEYCPSLGQFEDVRHRCRLGPGWIVD
ncbi:hypothetical protein LMTR3_20070 [Bradyrhizobium sp. LMTR 3]|nr:hypothetical protein LMTR3_20070 [Bradyrhizobium sp. LMTR 3]